MIKVGAFSPGQTTRSFPDGAPQRENYESDAALFRAELEYAREWRRTYRCAGCGDPVCPGRGKGGGR